MPARLTLVGFRACGKSTVGRLVAARLAWPFIDADHEIEQRIGRSIAAFFAEHGEAAFRDAEAACLAGLLAHDGPLVLATGGGAVLRPENRALFAARGGLVVYLDTPLTAIQDRLRHHGGGRPSLTGAPVHEEAARLHAQRDPLYREVAQAVVRPPGGSPESVADEVARLAEARYSTA